MRTSLALLGVGCCLACSDACERSSATSEPGTASLSASGATASAAMEEAAPATGTPGEMGATAAMKAADMTAAPRPPATAPRAGSLRLVLYHEHELLGSEERALGALVEALDQPLLSVTRARASEAERRAVEAQLSEESPALPEPWTAAETVVALRLAPPRETRRGSRVGRGLLGALVLRAGAEEPLLRMRAEEASPLLLAELEAIAALVRETHPEAP